MSDTPEDFFDLDAAAAEQRANRTPWRVRHGGEMWQMDNAFNLDLELIERAEGGDIGAIREALRIGLGEQYDAFRAKGLDLSELTILFGRWVERSGSQAGESAASSGSSASTGRPSKPTSNGSTASASPQRSGVARKSAARRASS